MHPEALPYALLLLSCTVSCRCAILLDELDGYRGLRKGRAMGHIVVETRTPNAVPLLRFSCSKRVIALPAGHMNARRVSELLPISAVFRLNLT